MGNVRDLKIKIDQVVVILKASSIDGFMLIPWCLDSLRRRGSHDILSMDCRVGFMSIEDARAFVVDRNRTGYLNKLGDRIATISMSTQDELLAQTFGLAKNRCW